MVNFLSMRLDRVVRLKIALKTTNKHAARVESCLATWLAGLDYVCVTDRPTGMFEEISCGVGEDYESAEEKTCNLFGMIRDGMFSDYDWVLLLDDDAVLDHAGMMDALSGLEGGMIHGYDMTRGWPADMTLTYPSGGGGYLVSPSLLRSMPPMNPLGIGLEDVRVGIWMRENGIRLGSSLPLGPWFPLKGRYWAFHHAEEESPEAVDRLFKELSGSDRELLRSKLTHHYVRGIATMSGIWEIMNDRESPRRHMSGHP